MKIKPIQDFVLLEKMEKEEKKGIIIPKDSDLDIDYGAKVLDIGENVKIPIKKGDIVLYKKYAFEEIHLENGEKYLFGKAENIFAVVND